MLVLPWSPDNQGGVTGVVQQLIAHWGDKQDLNPMLVVDDWDSSRASRRPDALYFRFAALCAVPMSRLPRALLRVPVALWRTWRLLKQEQVAAVNFHYTGNAPWGIAVLKRLGLYRGKLLISFHGTDVRPADDAMDDWLRSFCFRQADALVACSGSLANRMAATFQLARERISVILNGVDTEIFRSEAPHTTATQTLPDDYVVNVGAFIPRKAHVDLIDAFARAFADQPSVHLCLAGADGPTLAAVREQIQALGLGPRVHIFVGIGARDVAHLLARARLFVQTSLAESMPLSVLEAGAVGTPVAVSDIPGHDDLIVDHENGRLFAVSNPDACAAVMRDMLAERSTAQHLGTGFQRYIREHLTWTSCVEQYKGLYRPK